ncbi:MAG: molybdopterin-dependent oxidoreductase [Deltaproteobacteria bacterium]|nr:molybdopterin-dependent oxidoreductase [Deltaproteobacteria bacterium]
MRKDIYSICFMCTVRCPIKVTVEDGAVKWVEGNPHQLKGALCAKGSAGTALLNDTERLRYPMIREGARGEGKWKRVSWDQALDYAAQKLKAAVDHYGPQTVAFGERQNLNTHLSKTFMRALGSPNHFTHDALCKGSVNTAFRTLTGYTDAEVAVDWVNTKHVILYGRNLFESLELKPIQALLEAKDKGARITYIDIRSTITASHADRFWMIRPGTDLALNYALIHVILRDNLYDEEYVNRWVTGLTELRAFVEPYTPEWAEEETGIPAGEIVALAREVGGEKPQVIFHYGYRGASHLDEIYFRRSLVILNALMGSIESKGGLIIKKGPKDAGFGSFGKLVDQKDLPKPKGERFDGAGGSRFPIADPAHGVAAMLPLAILNEDPYPLKALIIHRFDPMLSIPDYNQNKKALDKLDLILTIDINFSETAWYSDVILPESIYLERSDSIQMAAGPKPALYMRRQCIPPRYDTKPFWEIIRELARRLDLGRFFPYDSIEDIWDLQLKDMGVSIKDFEAKGFVSLAKNPILWDRKEGLKFKTPSGKIEFVSSLMEQNGFLSFLPYKSVTPPPEGEFRLTVGRSAVHTHVSTQNNPYLNELLPENVLWLNTEEASRLGIADGQYVEVHSDHGFGRLKALVTDFIHPEAVFMLHGFGRQVPATTRCYGKGASDTALQENVSDVIGGSPGLHETFVRVRPAS